MTGELYSYSKKVAHPLKVSSPMATQHTAQSAKIVGVVSKTNSLVFLQVEQFPSIAPHYRTSKCAF